MKCGHCVFRTFFSILAALVFTVVFAPSILAANERFAQSYDYEDPYQDNYERDPEAQFDDDFDSQDPDPARGEGDPQENSLMRELMHFVQYDYLGNGRLNHVSDVGLFAPRVDYYGRRQISRGAVDASRHSYYRKWSERRYELIPDSVRIRQRGHDSVDIAFDYNFELSGRRKRIRGIGRTRLTVRQRDEDGAFEITRESGRVVRRY